MDNDIPEQLSSALGMHTPEPLYPAGSHGVTPVANGFESQPALVEANEERNIVKHQETDDTAVEADLMAIFEPSVTEPSGTPMENDIIITTNEGQMFMPSPCVLDKSIPTHGLPPVPRKASGQGPPYAPPGWSWRIITDEITKHEHYFSDIRYHHAETHVSFQRRKPLVHYFMMKLHLDEEAALAYVDARFPRIEAFVSSGEDLSKRRKSSGDKVQGEPPPAHSPTFDSEGEANARTAKKRGRIPKRKGNVGNLGKGILLLEEGPKVGPLKRRGRVPKHSLTPGEETFLSEGEAEVRIGKKRGRVPKHAGTTPDEGTFFSEGEGEVRVPKKRGRIPRLKGTPGEGTMRSEKVAEVRVVKKRVRTPKDKGTPGEATPPGIDTLDPEVRIGKKRGRKPKFRGSTAGEGAMSDEAPTPPHGLSSSEVRVQQELMEEHRLEKEKNERTGTKLADFLRDGGAWAGLEPSGQRHKDFFDFVQQLRSEPERLKVFQDILLQQNLTLHDLHSHKKEVVQIFALLLSTSKGIKYQNKSVLLEEVLKSDLWQAPRQKPGFAKPKAGTPKSGGGGGVAKPSRLGLSRTRVPLLTSTSPSASPPPAAATGRQGLGEEGRGDRSLALTVPRLSEEGVVEYATASPPGIAESVGEGTRAVKEKVADIINKAKENHFPPVDMTMTFGAEGEKALEAVKVHESDIRNRLEKMVGEQKAKVMAEVESIGQARQEVEVAESELEEAKRRLEQAQRGLEEKRRKVKEGESRVRKLNGSPKHMDEALKQGLESLGTTTQECDVALRRYLQMRKVVQDEPDLPMDDAGMSKSVQAHAAVSESLKVYQSLRRQMEAHLPKSALS